MLGSVATFARGDAKATAQRAKWLGPGDVGSADGIERGCARGMAAALRPPEVASTRPRSNQETRRNMGEIINKAKGRIKRAAGALTGNAPLENEGAADELEGQVDGVVADVKRAAKHVVRSVKKAVK